MKNSGIHLQMMKDEKRENDEGRMTNNEQTSKV